MTSTVNPSNFNELGLIPELLARLSDLEYTQPTHIQAKAIPSILAGSDLIAGANTGSGKTATFALPMLQKCFLGKAVKKTQGKGNFVSGLILVPTRELAVQVADSVKSYSANLNGAIKTVAVFGGVSVNTQMQALRGGADIYRCNSWAFT